MSIKSLVFNFLPLSVRTRVRYWYKRAGADFEKEFFFVPKLVRSIEGAIDIGANFGVYTYHLSRFFSHVDAFEPQPWCVEELVGGAISGVQVHPVALSDKCGETMFYVPISSGKLTCMLGSVRPIDGEARKITVKLARLDDFIFRNVSFIKIDVEGHELEVLKGAEGTIKKHRPLLLVEIEQKHQSGRSINETFEFLRTLGYHGYFVCQNQLVGLSIFSYEKHQKPYLEDDGDERYVNNFIFSINPVDCCNGAH